MRSPLDPLNVSRDQVALRGLEQAVSRIRRLEREIEACFSELERARQACHEMGIEMQVMLAKPVDAAWAAWRNKGYADKT